MPHNDQPDQTIPIPRSPSDPTQESISTHFSYDSFDQLVREEGRKQVSQYVEFLTQRNRAGLEQLAQSPQAIVQAPDGSMVTITGDGTQRPTTVDDTFYFQQLDSAATDPSTAVPFLGPGGLTFGSPDADFPLETAASRAIPGSSLPTSRRPGQDPAPVTGPSSRVVPFRYRAQDAARSLLDMSPAALLSIQREMAEAGLIREPTGRVDTNTIGAMQEIMGMANVNGLTWNHALDTLRSTNLALISEANEQARAKAIRDALSSRTFTYDPYVPPDYDTLTTSVRDLFRQQLGRDPDSHELTILADKMRSLHQASYDSQLTAARQKFDAENQAITQHDPDSGEPLVVEPGTAPEDVDVMSSIQELFNSKYGGEMDRVERAREAMASGRLTTQALLGMNSLVSTNDVNQL